jgi:hypothetical protein
MTMNTMSGNGGFTPKQPFTRDILRVVVVTAAILMIPLVAMQFTNEVVWDLFDFAVAGALIGMTGLLFVTLFRLVSNSTYRAVGGVGLAGLFLLVWAELAVGIFR